jgi:hypothetical protein
MRGTRAERIWCLVPLVFALPVFAGIALTLGRLVTADNVLIGYGSAIDADAIAMFLGHWPYRDPATGYFAEGYTPLYPALVSVLHRVHFWRGWPIVVTVTSGLVLLGYAARLAYRRGPSARWLRLAEALGIGALAWSIVDTVDDPTLYGGRVDQFAWALAFGGLMLLPRALAGSNRAAAVMALLLSLGFWAKQPALAVAAAVVIAAVLATFCDRGALRRVAVVSGLTAIANGLVLAVLTALTDGWQARLNLTAELPRAFGLWHGTSDLLVRSAGALGLLAALVAIAAWSGRRPQLDARRIPPLPTALVLAALLCSASAIWLRRYYGGADNNYVGALWALGFLVALAYRQARLHVRRAPVVAMALIALATTTLADRSWTLRHGELLPEERWASLPGDFVAFTRHNVIYDSLAADINAPEQRVVFPHHVHIVEALDRGIQPRWFVELLLERRFDAIYGFFGTHFDPELVLSDKAEDAYFWKLNRVIEAGYVKSSLPPAEPAGFEFGNGARPVPAMVPRRGPGPAPWIRWCFSPFRVAGSDFEIGNGGGLWCSRPGSDVLRMRGTPLPVTHAESVRDVHTVRGKLRVGVAARPGERWSVQLAGDWRVDGTVRSDLEGVELELSARGRAAMRAFVSRAVLRHTKGTVTLRFVPSGVALPDRPHPDVVTLPGTARTAGPLVLGASAQSDARFAFGAAAVE